MALINIAGKSYELVIENKSGWNAEAFRNRYSEVLERYDYIVGDWGYNQLRLKGFFKEGNSKATKDSAFSFVVDYINEYCNFGCAYFVLEKKSDHGEQTELEEVDPLVADLDDDYVATEKAGALESGGGEAEENHQDGAEVVEIKQAKHHANRNQDKQTQQKSQDKPFKRRSFKQRQNKNNANATPQDEPVKEPAKKNKRRSNRPFKQFDRKKNKEQISSNQE